MTSQGLQPDPAILQRKVEVPEHVVFRRFVQETVILNLNTGRYHGLNPVGGRMLEVLEQSATVADAAAVLAEEYEQPLDKMRQDVVDFCSDLAQRGLIELDGG